MAAKKQSELPSAPAIADDDTVTGLKAAATLPGEKNVNYEFQKIASYALSKAPPPSKTEAEAGAATTARLWTAERVKQAILALAPTGLKHKWDATAAPAGTNDGTQGYAPGSLWMRPAENRVWICKSAATNVAAWIELTGGEGGGGGLDEEAVNALIEAALEGSGFLGEGAVNELIDDALEELEGAGEDNPAPATEEEAEAGTEEGMRSWSPALIRAAVEALAGDGGGGGGTPYERLCADESTPLASSTHFHFFVAPVAGTVVWMEAESTQDYGNSPTVRPSVDGTPTGTPFLPSVGASTRKCSRVAQSVAVSAGQSVGVYVVDDGGYYSMNQAKGLRAILQFVPS